MKPLSVRLLDFIRRNPGAFGDRVSDLDLANGTFYVRRPKGGDSYGSRRTVPVRPEVRGILSLYIRNGGLRPEDLIFGIGGSVVSSNSLGIWRSKVCEGCGVQFDFRKLRRTYGQYLLDEGWSLSDVSVLLGHTNVMTTNMFYAGARPQRVVQNVLSGWDSEKQNDNRDFERKLAIADYGNVVQGKDFLCFSSSAVIDFSFQSVLINSGFSLVDLNPIYSRVSGLHTSSGFAGTAAERSAPCFSQSSYPMTGGDPPIF